MHPPVIDGKAFNERASLKVISRNSRKIVDVVDGEDLPRAAAGRDICLQAAGEGGGAGV